MEKAAEQVREARTESVRQSYLKTKKNTVIAYGFTNTIIRRFV